MLYQYLPPEERKGESKYRHGDWIMFDDRPTEEQQRKAVEDAMRYGGTVSNCDYCGRYIVGAAKRYCSDRCRNDAYMERRRQRHEAKLRKSCAVCGKAFTAKRADAKYCSPACKQSAYRRSVIANRSGQFTPTDSGNVTDNRCANIGGTDNGNGKQAKVEVAADLNIAKRG